MLVVRILFFLHCIANQLENNENILWREMKRWKQQVRRDIRNSAYSITKCWTQGKWNIMYVDHVSKDTNGKRLKQELRIGVTFIITVKRKKIVWVILRLSVRLFHS